MVSWGLQLAIEDVTGARHIQFIPIENIQKAMRYLFITQYPTRYANLLIKASVCAMLLRIMPSQAWRTGLWSLLMTLVVIGIVFTVTNTAECRPISAFWSLSMADRAKSCWNNMTVSVIAIVLDSYYVVTDFILALLPLVFIRQLRRPRRDKIVLAVLMGCGLVATAAGIAKMVFTHWAEEHPIDYFYETIRLSIFSHLELFLGITACCIPCLKALWDQTLRRLGFEVPKSGTPYKLTTYESRNAQNGVRRSLFSRRVDAQTWEDEPASAADVYVSPNGKDVIVKESCES